MEKNIQTFGMGHDARDVKGTLDVLEQDAWVEQQEKESEYALGVQAFLDGYEEVIRAPGYQPGDRWSSVYAPIVRRIPKDLLGDSEFWGRVFLLPAFHDCPPDAILNGLPTDDQEKVAPLFFQQEKFAVGYVSRSVLEMIPPDQLVEKAWKNITAINAPWGTLAPSQKRVLFFKLHLSDEDEVSALHRAKKELVPEALSAEEWKGHWRDFFADRAHIVKDMIEEGKLDLLTDCFSKAEILDLLKGDSMNRLAFYRVISLPALRSLEATEWDVRAWWNEQGGWNGGWEKFDQFTPEDRQRAIARLDDGFFEEQEMGDDYVYRGPKSKELHAFIRTRLGKIIKGMNPAAVEETMGRFGSFVSPTNADYEVGMDEIAREYLPTLFASQGAGAFRILDTLGQGIDAFEVGRNLPIIDCIAAKKESLQLLKKLTTELGVKMQDFLQFYLAEYFQWDDGGWHGYGKELADNPEMLSFLEQKLPWTHEIFTSYKDLLAEGVPVAIAGERLRKQVQEDIKIIHEGEWPEDQKEQDRIAGLLTHVFPPALGVSREEYRRLVDRRDDRQEDLPFALQNLSGKEAVFATGAWKLRQGEIFTTTAWGPIMSAVKGVHEQAKGGAQEKDQKPLADWGRDLLACLGPTPISAQEALSFLYRRHLALGGSKMPEAIIDREEASRVTEWSHDALRDLVDGALKAYRDLDATAYDAELTRLTSRQISESARKVLLRSLQGVFAASMSDERKNIRMKDILSRAGIVYEGDMFAELSSAEDKEVFLAQLIARASGGSSAGKTSAMILQKLLGETVPSMQKELEKWSFVEGEAGGEKRTVTFVPSKKKGHAMAGLNMGVCVAVDDQLWGKETFTNVILFGDDGVARGGMHFETVEDDREKYLSLPGINPSNLLLREARPEQVLVAMLDFAKDAAKAMGAKCVLIPTNSVIFSNREELHGLITRMKLPKMTLSKEHQFSYSPYAYSWQEAYVLEI